MFSWLIQEILGALPSWIWPALASVGVVVNLLSGVLAHLPQFKPWHTFIKPVSWLAIIFGIFMYGGAGVAAIYQAEIKDMENKVAVAQEKSNSVNTVVQTKIQQTTKVIHDTQVIYQDRIKEVTKEIDKDCKFDAAASKILNDAAVNPEKVTK